MRLKDLFSETLILPNYNPKIRNDEFDSDLKHAKLIKDDIQPRSQKLYYFANRYYLASSNNEYLGHIEFNDKNISGKKCLMIGETNSQNSIYKIQGFYKIMFNHILTHTDFDVIFNDEQESKVSIDSWKRLMSSRLNFVILDQKDNKIKPFNHADIETYWTTISGDWQRYRVGVTANKLQLKESSDEILRRELHRAKARNETYENRAKYRDEAYFRMEEIRFLGLNDDDYIEGDL